MCREQSWQDVEDASAKDEVILALNELITAGTPDERALWPDELAEYYRHRDHLSTIGPVVLFKDRAVLPVNLRKDDCIRLLLLHWKTVPHRG
jgi:hypothetical protein